MPTDKPRLLLTVDPSVYERLLKEATDRGVRPARLATAVLTAWLTGTKLTEVLVPPR